MSWQDGLRANSVSWLLEPDAPGVRYLAMRDLVGLPESHPELRAAREAAHTQGPIAAIMAAMYPDGYWIAPGPGYNPKYRSTVWSVILLAQLGASAAADPRIAKACAYVLDHTLAAGGQFSTSGAPSGTVDCLQGNLAWALPELGYQDARLAAAYDWMARSVTGEGLAPASERDAPARYYAYKCGPGFQCGANYRQPCAWGGVKVLQALARVPPAQRTPVIERALRAAVDYFLSVDPADAPYPLNEDGRPSRNWRKLGFPAFYRTDLLQLVEALMSAGCGTVPRLARALDAIRALQDAAGRWALEHDYAGKTWVDFGAKGEPNKWVTLRALRVLKAAG